MPKNSSHHTFISIGWRDRTLSYGVSVRMAAILWTIITKGKENDSNWHAIRVRRSLDSENRGFGLCFFADLVRQIPYK